ncbi:MAG: hypothetical protein AAF597_16725, partial [Bacteroidota bacterium]
RVNTGHLWLFSSPGGDYLAKKADDPRYYKLSGGNIRKTLVYLLRECNSMTEDYLDSINPSMRSVLFELIGKYNECVTGDPGAFLSVKELLFNKGRKVEFGLFVGAMLVTEQSSFGVVTTAPDLGNSIDPSLGLNAYFPIFLPGASVELGLAYQRNRFRKDSLPGGPLPNTFVDYDLNFQNIQAKLGIRYRFKRGGFLPAISIGATSEIFFRRELDVLVYRNETRQMRNITGNNVLLGGYAEVVVFEGKMGAKKNLTWQIAGGADFLPSNFSASNRENFFDLNTYQVGVRLLR